MNIDKMEAGPELDALAAKKVLGWYHDPAWEDCAGFRSWWFDNPEFKGYALYLDEMSDNVAAAWILVEKLCGDSDRVIQFRAELAGSPDRQYAKFVEFKDNVLIKVYGSSDANIATAICRASVKAVGV